MKLTIRGEIMLIKWGLSLFIYLAFFVINLKIKFYNPVWYLWLLLIACVSIGIGLFIITKRRIKTENQLCRQTKPLSEFNLIVSTVFKNEGNTVVETLKHYLHYKSVPEIVFYDDNSDDGSFEVLKSVEATQKAHCTVKRLNRSEKILHPKGMGFEDLIKNHCGDYILILDADTIIEEEAVEKALNIMSENDLKVLHFTRRNDLSDDLANNIADTEELFSTVNKIVGIFPWYFNGSGFIISVDIAKKIVYDEYSPSDDSQISFFLRKNKIEVFDALSLFAHEKAPQTLRKLLKQHSSWTKGGIHHYLEKERFTIFPVAFISAYLISSILNPLQIYNLFFPLAFIFIFGVDFISNRVVAGRGILKSLKNSLFHTFGLFFKGIVLVPYHLVTFPFRRHTFWFSRTQY